MKAKSAHSVIALIALIAVIALAWTACVGPTTAQGQYTSRGEEYFLIRTLESLYDQWPMDVSDPAAFTAAAAELRQEAIRLKVRAEQANLHASVIDGFTDFVALLDDYTKFLENIGAIQQDAMKLSNKVDDEFDSVLEGLGAATLTFGTLSTFLDGGLSVLASGIFGVVNSVINSWEKASAREDAARKKVTAEAQRILDRFTTTLERTRQRFAQLAQSKGWGEHEIGWNSSPSNVQALSKMFKQGDVEGLLAEVSRQRTARPFDPFIALECNLLLSFLMIDNATNLDQLSSDTYSLRQLIPSDNVYSKYKFRVVRAAAMLASKARYAERKGGASPHSSERSRRAVELWEEAYGLHPSVPSAKFRMQRAIAYAADGDTTKALLKLKPLFELLQKDGEFLYTISWIFSLDGEYDTSLRYLILALHTDTQNLTKVRTDPNLADLRKHRQEQFQKLTTPQWSWKVENGLFSLFSCDVSLTNDSLFTLTNVKLVSETEGWNPDLTVDSLRPGQTKTWGRVSQPPADKRVKVSLKCDQNP